MCVDLMLMIKNGNKNAVSGGCGLNGGWIPYGGNSGIYNSAATSAGVVSCGLRLRISVAGLNADFRVVSGHLCHCMSRWWFHGLAARGGTDPVLFISIGWQNSTWGEA